MRSARPACAIRLSSSLACLALWGCGADVTSGSTSASVSASASATSAAEVSSSASTERSASPSQRRADLELTPDAFLARGPATLVLGTLGDDRADRDMRAQAEVLRSALPGATVIDDASIDVAGGVAAWPKNPILFGGAHVNRVVAALAPVLPLSADETRIEIGGARIDAPGSRIVAIVPARAADPAHPGHPTLLLYAGLGTPGITEINGGMRHGGEPILIGDSFGRLRTGVWSAAPDGGLRAALGEPARRDTWRRSSRDVAGVAMTIAFPSGLEATPDDERVVDAVGRGLASSAKRLALTAPPPLTVYVYPNREAKKALTGDGGDGHAMVIGRTLHVRRADAAPGGGLERLVAHEGTHVFAAEAWGGTGSALMGEGLAVWVSGAYQGKPLSEWAKTLTPRPPIASLLPLRAFRARPEAETYPLGGLLVTAAVARVGLENVRDHLYSAGAEDWAAACVRAGTSAEQLDHDLAAMK